MFQASKTKRIVFKDADFAVVESEALKLIDGGEWRPKGPIHLTPLSNKFKIVFRKKNKKELDIDNERRVLQEQANRWLKENHVSK